MLVWIANAFARLFAPLEPAPAYVPVRLRRSRRPLRRRTFEA